MKKFNTTIELKKGLRPQENIKTEDVYLVKAQGVLNKDGALHTIEWPSLLTTPDPVIQIQQLKNHVIVITTTHFYELINGNLVPKIALASSETWGIADYGEFILFNDSTRTVSRDPLSGAYEQRYDIPKGFDAINYNGQCLIIGAINV